MNKFIKAILALVVVWLLLYGVSVLYANGGSGKGEENVDGNKTDGNKTDGNKTDGNTGSTGGNSSSSSSSSTPYYPVKYGSRDGKNHVVVKNIQTMANAVNNQLWAAGVKNELGGKRQIKVDGIWGPDTDKAAKMLFNYYVWHGNQKDFCWRRGIALRRGSYVVPTRARQDDMVKHFNSLQRSGLINEASLLNR